MWPPVVEDARCCTVQLSHITRSRGDVIHPLGLIRARRLNARVVASGLIDPGAYPAASIFRYARVSPEQEPFRPALGISVIVALKTACFMVPVPACAMTELAEPVAGCW